MNPIKKTEAEKKAGVYQDLIDLARRLSAHNTEQSLSLYRQALSKEIIKKDKRARAECFYGIGAIEYQRGNYTRA